MLDLLIAGGEVVDPSQGLSARRTWGLVERGPDAFAEMSNLRGRMVLSSYGRRPDPC